MCCAAGGYGGGGLDAEPAVDGIFRAVPNTASSGVTSGVAPGKAGRWVVTLNLAGELYQAHFDTQEDAGEAFHAAGGLQGKEELGHHVHATGHTLAPPPPPTVPGGTDDGDDGDDADIADAGVDGGDDD